MPKFNFEIFQGWQVRVLQLFSFFHKISQLQRDLFDIFCFLAGAVLFICLTRSKNISVTPIFDLAEVSMNVQLPNCLAIIIPWSFPTTLSSSKSHLLPTNTIGTSSVSFTLNICSFKSWRSLKVLWAVML